MHKKIFKLGAVAVVAALGLTSLQANAATFSAINVFNDTDINSSYSATQRGILTCSSCDVLTYSGGLYAFDSTVGELFDGPTNSGDANEASWVNLVTGSSFTGTDVGAGKNAGTSGVNYITNALYVILKIGTNPNYTVVRNTSGGSFNFSWSGLRGTGAGLSHYVELGASQVPIPAAGVLLIGALGGLGFAGRRRRKA